MVKNIQQTIAYMETFLNLPKGWNYGEGIPVKEENLATARSLLFVADRQTNIEVTEAFPGNYGEVGVHFYINGYCFGVDVEGNNRMTVMLEKYKDHDTMRVIDLGVWVNQTFNSTVEKLKVFNILFE